jgi:3-oxoacyl-[acyl-carrier-protein] synthase III
VHSLLPDRLIPNNGPAVQVKAGLSNAVAWSVDVGCGSLHAHVAIAASLVQSGLFRCPVVVQSSCWSRFIDVSQPNSVGFGDAATAAVLGPAPAGHGLLSHHAKTDGTLRDGIVFAPMHDGVAQPRWWDATAAGPVRMTSFDVGAGKAAGQRATELCRLACDAALADAGVGIDDIALFLCNQSTGWFVGACRRALGISAEKSLDTFAEIANVNESALLYNLIVAERAGRLKNGDLILMYSPSAGFTRSALVYRWWRPKPPTR